MQFEYKSFDIEADGMEEKLSAFGKAGWELAGFTQDSDSNRRSGMNAGDMQNATLYMELHASQSLYTILSGAKLLAD